MMKTKNFAVFIITHGRPYHQSTLSIIKKYGYTGKIYLICDDEDETLVDYQILYNNVIVFKKSDYIAISDRADNDPSTETALYARNATFPIAKSLGLDYVLELDDDYEYFSWRYCRGHQIAETQLVGHLDNIFDAYCTLLEKTGAYAISTTQNGDYVGSSSSFVRIQGKRKCVNTWFFNCKKPFNFLGRMNDDVSTYVMRGMRGDLFFSVGISLKMKATQQAQGGLSELYKKSGNYMKSFYTVLMCPSAVKIAAMGHANPRIHHKISWNNCVPKILHEKYRKFVG